MNKSTVIALLIAVVCGAGAVWLLKGSLTPYVSFSDAEKGGRYIQCMAFLDKTVPVIKKDGSAYFTVYDQKKNQLRVKTNMGLPLNFEHAPQMVIIGEYDTRQKIFVADKILVKCPSKYERGEK